LRYLFEEYAFDTDRRELHRGTDAVSIKPQVFDLLEYLIRNRERVVSKDDLIKAIWNGRSVSDAALTTRLNAARQSAIPARNNASSKHYRARASASSDRCGRRERLQV
jgi:DNA-binding winged helix-turn-helix (wHTH) protein